MKKIIEWVKASNHYYHIGLLAALSLIIMSVGAFEYGHSGLWLNVWQTIKFGILTGLVIEAYQVIVYKSFNLKNSLGDLLADVIGLVLGTCAYILLAICSPITAIGLYIISFVSAISAVFYEDKREYLLMAFLGCAIVGFSLFIYA